MKRTWFGMILAAGLVSACGTNETREVREAETTVGETTPPRESAARMLVSRMMAEAATQAEMGRLAATRSGDKDIRQFGRDVAEDQSGLSQDLAGIAARFGSIPPYTDEAKRDLIDRLSKLEGAAFDREYIEVVSNRYSETLAALQASSASRDKTGGGGPTDRPEPTGTSGDTNEAQVVEEWAAKAAPTMQTHLDRAQTLRERVMKSAPAASSAPAAQKGAR